MQFVDILLIAGIAAAVILAVIRIIRTRKKGGCGCGCGCSNCEGCAKSARSPRWQTRAGDMLRRKRT